MWNHDQDLEQQRKINSTVTQELLPLLANLVKVTSSCVQTLSLTNFIRRPKVTWTTEHRAAVEHVTEHCETHVRCEANVTGRLTFAL